jgi:hypothetical protein
MHAVMYPFYFEKMLTENVKLSSIKIYCINFLKFVGRRYVIDFVCGTE